MIFQSKLLFLLGLLLCAGTTQSAIFITNSSGDITGIAGVEINGNYYNAIFHNFPLDAPAYGDEFALDASNALLSLFTDCGDFSDQPVDLAHTTGIVGFEGVESSFNFFNTNIEINSLNIQISSFVNGLASNDRQDLVVPRSGIGLPSSGIDSNSATYIEWIEASQVTMPDSITSVNLFPLIPTSTYTYTDGSVVTRTEIVREPTTFNGVNVTGIEDNEGDIEYFTNDCNGLFSHGTENVNDGDTSVFNPPAKVVEGTIEVGQTVNSSGTTTFNIDGEVFVLSYISTSTVVGEETIMVAAGTFDAVRVQVSINLSGIINLNQNSTYWYAENIGLIREETTINGEILNDELESYFIPSLTNTTPQVSVPIPVWSLFFLAAFFICFASIKNKKIR